MEDKKTTLGEVHPDMSRYLQEDCYCPGEIYGIDGFFYQIFESNEEVVVVEQNDNMTVVVGKLNEECPQCVLFWHDEPRKPGKIIESQRVDATENNIGILKTIAQGGKPDGRKLDEFKPGATAKAVNDILSISDMVIVD